MPQALAPTVNQKTHIIIKNAYTHNLKGVTVALRRGKFIVITGLSGSGKSSLAFDTLYAEGQRRYVESLSSYARQFLDKMDKPEVESILGISPAIAIEQKVTTRNARSTVGTSTEIYDYLKLLFARAGHTISPISGKEVKRHTTTDVVNFISNLEEGAKCLILAPLYVKGDRTMAQQVDILMKQGYARVSINGELKRLDEIDADKTKKKDQIHIVIDRIVNKKDDEENISRIGDSIETAFFEGNGDCIIQVIDGKKEGLHPFSNRFELDGMQFEIPNEYFFSFNNPVGACKTCEGFGNVIGIDPDSVIPNKKLSIYDDAVMAWRGEKMEVWKNELVRSADKFDFPIHRPYHQLTDAQKDLLWTGNKHFKGLNAFFKYIESKSYKIQYRVMLSRYRGKTTCPDCKGSRLRKDATYVKVDGYSIVDFLKMPVKNSLPAMRALHLNENDRSIAKRLLIEIDNRLQFLNDVGLGYLSLDRMSNTLSGGESQRIKLATSLGSSLVGSMYILDEPSIGLHPHDTTRLISVLRSLQKLGNTVIVVEHDEEIMKAADDIIDMGPGAGTLGGEVVFQGNHDELIHAKDSLTADYLTGKIEIAIPAKRKKWKNSITIKGAREHNLKDIDVTIPLESFVAVTGMSGSGKSTLITDIFYPAIQKQLGQYGSKMGEFDELEGDLRVIRAVEFVDQNPIGKSSRSNPVTYVKAFDEIRSLYASQKLSKMRNYKPGHFSFNVKGGRCETCEGEGLVRIEMQFMADIQLTCESCKGKRYKDETLEIKYRGKNISEILKMTVDESIDFFKGDTKLKSAQKIVSKLEPLQKVGLGYVQLGQSSSTLSGGEAQRTKLAAFLAKGDNEPHTLFIFDEPTTGLHFHDVAKLLESFRELLNRGHSVIVIEHNLDIIKSADWVIDLGPEGGEAGGNLVFAGTPEGLIECPDSVTGGYLKAKFG
ncbi:excinuclease ABC subunit UvrA [Cryomorpha ignava]|uniref:UvrABC system protein A n=1 Tax=Cryomorpha ignava TaxID=101383 RepID=A0A7K3WL73_9FLAO|nr:excinuclease ABC subunit UvrA [Cryomorpha ignava]NEN22390.1 excinuclease ABC subunit UvrA [Cryomorpha ignava]